MKQLYSPFSFGFIQYFIVFGCSLIIALLFENPILANIQLEWFEIIYTGVFSAGIGYTLQIIAQSKAHPAPAAIILSMESVFGTIAAWLILSQTKRTVKLFHKYIDENNMNSKEKSSNKQ